MLNAQCLDSDHWLKNSLSSQTTAASEKKDNNNSK